MGSENQLATGSFGVREGSTSMAICLRVRADPGGLVRTGEPFESLVQTG